MCDKTIQFRVLCNMFEAISKARRPAVKRKHLRTFFDHVYTDRECYSALRLILPSLDRERSAYGLKEAVLAKCISDALGLAKDSSDTRRLLDWKKGENIASGSAGNFPLVASDILFRRQSTSSGNLTIKDVNDYLDRLASSEDRDEKTAIISVLIKKTNVKEMTWIIKIILYDLKLGVGEKTVLQEFHSDAESILNVSCDLKLVCEKLKNRNERLEGQKIVIGIPVRPQLACRVTDVEEAWRKLGGKHNVAECKFDGDRIQIHKNGNEVYFFSRSFIDHKEYREGMAGIICKQVKIDKCILDGEMMVWNKIKNRFANFGSNQGAAKAAKNGLESDEQLCYIAFDILYAGDNSVTDQPLYERQALLKQVVDPLKGSLELILPGSGSCQEEDQPPWSMVVNSSEEINKFFLRTVENRDEGIILKDLDSKWEPGDRSQKWLKLKPDYVHAETDLDALIIGCFIGSGRRGGEISQFLLGLAEKPKDGGYPTKFLSFCRVGSGLSDSERDVLVIKLKPYLKRNDKNTKPPSCYILTNVGKERPDFWVEQPDKSVIVEINSDIRSIRSEYFATPYSLRFPRVTRVRYDKPWYDCLDVDALVQIVLSRSGNVPEQKDREKRANNRRPRIGSKVKRTAQSLPVVPSHLRMTDVSHVKQETNIFKGLVFHIINTESETSRDDLHKLVIQNGGMFSMNLSASVTHVIAAQKKGMQYRAAAMKRDVMHVSWVLDCCAQRALLPLRPKYFLHLSKDSSKFKAKEDVDEFGDNHFEDLDVVDLRQMFANMDRMAFSVSKVDICRFESKHCKKEGFGEFCECNMFFCNPSHVHDEETQMVAEVALKRLELGLLTRAGDVTRNLKDATHMIIYSSEEHPVTIKSIMETMPLQDRCFLMSKSLHVVKHTWLEDALANKRRPEEQLYSLKSSNEELNLEDNEKLKEACAQEKLPNVRKRGKMASKIEPGNSEYSSRRRLFEEDSNAMEDAGRSMNNKNNRDVGKRHQTAERGISRTEPHRRVIDGGGKRVFKRSHASETNARKPEDGKSASQDQNVGKEQGIQEGLDEQKKAMHPKGLMEDTGIAYDMKSQAAPLSPRLHSKRARLSKENDAAQLTDSHFGELPESIQQEKDNPTAQYQGSSSSHHRRENEMMTGGLSCLSGVYDVSASRPGIAEVVPGSDSMDVPRTTSHRILELPPTLGKINDAATISGGRKVEGTLNAPKKKVSYRELAQNLFGT